MQPIEQTGLPDALRSQYDNLKRAFSEPYPMAWDDEASYRDAQQPAALGRVLVCSVHRHLRNREIGYLYRQKMERNGKTVLGKASKVGSKLAYFSSLEFLIEINWTAWAGLTARQRIALVDHELCHLGIEDTDEGEKLVMIPHDLEEFGGIVQRWGLWQPDVANFAKICQQRDLFSEPAEDVPGLQSTVTMQFGDTEPITMTSEQLSRAAAEIKRTSDKKLKAAIGKALNDDAQDHDE